MSSSFSIVTNVNSLLAQENLGRTNASQTQAIQRLTSGLRINSSSDDAAGLAIANRFRSDIAVLQQGVRNAADGLSTLQTIDGGLNNISLLLDRARTLATQSASGTFTGDRNTLNSEFQSVVEEIDRQAQAIGLDPGGRFNSALQVFIGGGRENNGVSAVQNGAVSIDLSNSAVSSQILGLEGFQALGGTEGTTDLGASSATSVENIVNDATNVASLDTAGFTEFVFQGAGFTDDEAATLSVNLSGVSDTSTLVTAINNAIEGFSAASAAGEAFKNAGVRAVVNTDSDGKQQLAFSSSDGAFQVKAGDQLANALLGNFGSGADGASLDVTRTGAASTATAAAGTIKVVIDGGGLTSSQEVSITAGAGDDQAAVVAALETAIGNNSTLADAGFTVVDNGSGNTVSFTNTEGESFNVRVVGDANNVLGFGAAELGATDAATYNTITSAYSAPSSATPSATLNFLLEGAETAQSITFTLADGATVAEAVDQINSQILNNATLAESGLIAKVDTGDITFETTTNGGGVNFLVSVNDDDSAAIFDDFGDAGANAVSAGTAGEAAGFKEATVNSGGAQATTGSGDPVSFTGLVNDSDVQNITISAKDDTGALRSLNIDLDNSNALTLDQAVDTINAAIQQSNDSTLQQVFAVKERDGAGTQGIRFLGGLQQGFNVSVGDLANDNGLDNDSSSDLLLESSALEGGSVADISSRENAETAVSLLATAVTKLGELQADVGRSQNRLEFAIGLATTQITNLSAAESRIRDADLAAEAANLTRTGIAQQAGVAALAQANSAPQAVLALLRG